MKSDLDFNKLFGRIRDIDQGKTPVTESSIVECGMPMNNIPSTPPVSMNVSLNAQGIDQIKSLLDLMHKAESPLAAGPVGSPAMPQAPMPTVTPMGVPGGAMSMPALSLDEPGFGGEPEGRMDPLDALVKKAGISMAPKAPADDAGEKSPMGSKDVAPKGDMKKVADEVRGMADTLADENQDGGFGGATTEPDEKYGDVSSVTATGNDLASKGKEAPKVNGGGNPMESIRAQLDARYKEIKESKSKQVLLGDKDGDKKEPMKKAVKDKEVKEAFPTVASTKKDAEGTAGMKQGEKKKSSTGGTIEKTKTGIKHTAGKNYSGKE
jgi:hypothetical protein